MDDTPRIPRPPYACGNRAVTGAAQDGKGIDGFGAEHVGIVAMMELQLLRTVARLAAIARPLEGFTAGWMLTPVDGAVIAEK